jgi:hypothetical protein
MLSEPSLQALHRLSWAMVFLCVLHLNLTSGASVVGGGIADLAAYITLASCIAFLCGQLGISYV